MPELPSQLDKGGSRSAPGRIEVWQKDLKKFKIRSFRFYGKPRAIPIYE